MSFKILIADDHFPVRVGLEMLVQEVLGHSTDIDFAGDGKKVIEKVGSGIYDILITDVNMPNTDCLDMIKKVWHIQPALKVLVVSVNPQQTFANIYMKAGAYGYINKGDSDLELKKAIQCISLGKRYFSHEQSTQLIGHPLLKVPDNPFDKLSNREFEVMLLLLKGNGAIEISNLLSLSPSTTSTYRGRVLDKLKVKNVMELSQLARKFQIVNDDSLMY
jgi:two-component system invasion response regulator UvrY